MNNFDDPDPVSETGSDVETGTDTGKAKAAPTPVSAASRARRMGGGAAGLARERAAASREPADSGPPVDPNADLSATRTRARHRDDGTATVPETSLSKTASAPATDTAEDDSSESEPKAALTFSVPAWLAWAPPVAFAAVAAVFIALFIADHVGNGASVTSNTERQTVLAAAKTCVATLNTYDYRTLDAAEKSGVACTTGRLTTDYQATMTNVIMKNAPELKSGQVAKINTAGIESVSPSGQQFTVLLYAQLNVSSANYPKGRVDPFAASAIMQKVGGKWLIAKINTVSSLSG
ncbi:MAG: hypothetical protein ABI345_01765 [Jatrophihabitans sp.]